METLQERRRRVASKGAELAVFEYGAGPGPGVPTLLLIHGYPDDHRVYLPAIRILARTHHVVAYDTRNAGASAVVGLPGDFTLTTLVDDLFAVLAAVAADDVHLVGHDWGSIQGWAAVQDSRAAGRIGRYTSISGPDLRHYGRWVRSRVSRPAAWPQLANQLIRSSYVGAFLLPKVPEAAWRLFLTRRYEQSVKRDVGNDPLRGLALYRANVLGPGPLPPRRRVSLPVQVVVPVKDPFVSPALVEGLEEWVEDLTVVRVDSGHWWPASRHKEFADLLLGTGTNP
jgi:pimeloyl-ACP methyl ester carboxylesterase